MTNVKPCEFSKVVRQLREFFDTNGYVEVHTQSRLSILAACEDPETIATFDYSGQLWPLPQTGQMWLEHELLNDPSPNGYYCLSTSYRDERNPVYGRHDLIFPMFEFETKGGIEELIKLEADLLTFLGFGTDFPTGKYTDVAKKYEVDELLHFHEDYIQRDHGSVFFLTHFPNTTSPFWNMRQIGDGTAAKVDVIIQGVETIGSAERSVDPVEMRNQFYSISNGDYARTLFNKFSKERVETELEDFLSKDFFLRSGGGIGVTRLIRAMKLSGLM